MKERIKKLLNFILVTVLLWSSLPLSAVYAQDRDISHSVVTELTVDPKEINDGGNARVSLKFAENNSTNIQGGDTITVTWTRQPDIEFSGYVRNMDLIVDGNRNVGTVEITQSSAILKFNNNVNNLENVKGFVEFDIQGRNFTKTSEEDTKIGTISSGSKNVNVSVIKPQSGTTGVFYYKTGNMDTGDKGHVNWWLNINCQQTHVVREVSIQDEIQEGHELEKGSFRISVTDYNKQRKDYSLDDFQKRYSGSLIYYPNEKKINVYIPQQWVSTNMFSIYYKTKIINNNQNKFVNNSKAWYQEYGKEAVEGKEFNWEVVNAKADSGITGTIKGELKIFKKVAGTEVGIPGVEFLLKNAQGTVIRDGKSELTLVTKQDGTANIKNLPIGTYVVREIKAPNWIDFNSLRTQEHKFEIKEEDKEGILLKIKNQVKTTNISVEKRWKDSRGKAKSFPSNASVEVELLRDGQPLVSNKKVTLTSTNSKAVFENLPQYDSSGNKYEYSVKELGLDKSGEIKFGNTWYKSEITGDVTKGYIVTNTEKQSWRPMLPPTTSLKVVKNWEGVTGVNIPKLVTVILYKDGKPTDQTKVLSSSNGWTASFENLENNQLGKNIKKHEYTIQEKGVVGDILKIADKEYKVSLNTTEANQTGPKTITITNKLINSKTKLEGNKIWEDKHNQDGKRPEFVTIRLLANGKETDITTTATKVVGDKWSYVFNDLDTYDKEGNKIEYSVKEENIAKGYTSKVEGTTITNTYIPKTAKVEGKKTWDDNNNQDGKRPTEITINLMKQLGSGSVSKQESKVVKADAQGHWKWTWKDLPEYENGKKIAYSITEDKVASYDTKVDGYNVTNSHTPGKVTVAGKKTWDDANNQDGKRPTEITINLMKQLGSGSVSKQESKVVKADAQGHWKWTWKNLPEYENGKKITYSITEDKVAGYDTKVDGYNVTNSHHPSKVSVEGKKTWDDANNQDGKRPTSIKITLKKRVGTAEAVVDTKTVKDSDGWKWTWKDLPEYENGKKITYSITEDKVEGYDTKVDGYNVTNSYTPGKTSVQVTKIWDDANNQDGKRPASVTIKLLADGKETGKSLTLTKATNWRGSFTDLEEYKAGKKLAYTVKEVPVGDGYTSVITGNAQEGYIVTNTKKPEQPTSKTPKFNTPKLPSTGEKGGLVATLIGFVILVVALVAAVVMYRKSQKA